MSTDSDRDGATPGRAVPFALRRDRRDDAEILVPVGELDIATAGELELGLELAATTPAARIVLDLRELSFIDSSGLNAILEAYRRLGGRLMVVRGPDHVRRLFALCGLDDRLVFVDGLPNPERSDPTAPNATGPHETAPPRTAPHQPVPRGTAAHGNQGTAAHATAPHESLVPAGEPSRMDP